MLHSCYLMVMSQSLCSKIKKGHAKSIDVTILFHSPTQHLTTFKWLFDASLCFFYLHPHHLSQIYSIVSSIGPLYMYVKTNKTREIYENGRNFGAISTFRRLSSSLTTIAKNSVLDKNTPQLVSFKIL